MSDAHSPAPADAAAPARPRDLHGLPKLAVELGPLGVFFAVNALTSKTYGLYPATAALMIATRRVDWYALGGGAAAPRAAVPDAAGA